MSRNSYFSLILAKFLLLSYLLLLFLLFDQIPTLTKFSNEAEDKILLNKDLNSAQILKIYLHIFPQTPAVCKKPEKPIIFILIWFKNLNLKNLKLYFYKWYKNVKCTSICSILSIYSYFFGRFLFLNSIPNSVLLFLQIPTSPTFYLSYLLDTLAYWVVQQHKRFISTNTCNFNLHLAYRSPDHYYSIFLPINSREVGYPDEQCARGGIFKIGSISNLSCYYQNQ